MLKQKRYRLGFLFIAFAILWYYPARNYGFVSDFLGWFHKYQNGSYADVIHCFGYNGLHQFFHLLNFTVFKLFGTSSISWSILFAAFHGLNSFLVFILVKDLTDRWQLKLPHLEWFAAVMFLIAPFQLEVVSWNACLHYLMSLFVLLSSLLLTIRLLNTKKLKLLIWIHLLFLISLFTLEINLSIPFILISLILVDLLKNNSLKQELKLAGLLIIPQVALLILYFLLNKVILGDWIGHYGTEVHLATPFSEIIGHAWAYVLHQLAYLDLFQYDTQRTIYSFLFDPGVSYSILILLLILFFWCIKEFQKLDSRIQLAGLFLIIFFMALVPILSLYFYYVTPFKNDRYLYFASPFLFISIGVLFYYLNRTWRHTLMILYVIAAGVLNRANISSTALAAIGADYMLQNFPCEDFKDKEIVLLGLGDNFRGNYLYSEYADDGNSFKKAMQIKYPERSCQMNILNPAQFNLKYGSDALGAQFTDDRTIKVFIKQNGTWFWRHGKGLASYETDRYKIETHGWYYLMHLKEGFDQSVFLYPDGAEWKVLERK